MKKRIFLFLAIGVLALGIGFAIFSLMPDNSRTLTFEKCENAGGTAWAVNLYHPDICPSCAEYQVCEEQNNGYSDIRKVCPQVIPCTECMETNFPYSDACPDGREKVGEISDAATWFQCCK
jgi:hypothetical protein